MAFKTYYKNIVKQQLFENVLFSEDVYSKFLIRNSFFLDNDISFGINFLNLFKKGFSIRLNKQIFKHLNYEKITFISFLNHHKFCKSFVLSLRLYSSLKIISESKKSKSTMLVLNPKKGGFKVYSNGIFAFLPTNQKFYCLKNFCQLKKEKNLSKILYFSLFFSKKHKFKTFFCFFLPLCNVKMIAYFNSKSCNFNTALQRRKFIKSRLNFLFLVQKRNLKLKKRFETI